MDLTDAVLVRVRNVDPISNADLGSWSESLRPQELFELVVLGETAAMRPPRHRARWVAGAAAFTAALGTAAAASGIIGEPAPAPIRAHLEAVDDGLPQDLRVNPDVDHARAVASTADGVLYAADLKDGGYCIEIAAAGDQPRGAVCVTAARLGDRSIEVTAPIPSGPGDALLVGGRINDSLVSGIVAHYPNGTSEDVVLGDGGYWLLEVPPSAREAALAGGLEIAGVDAGGLQVATESVPQLRDDDPDGTAHDRANPIFVSTISSGDDLTLVLGLEGSVNVDGATSLELQYPDGETASIALASDGSYHFSLPHDLQHDFATAWGKLVARDRDGHIVASGSFSSVANSGRPG